MEIVNYSHSQHFTSEVVFLKKKKKLYFEEMLNIVKSRVYMKQSFSSWLSSIPSLLNFKYPLYILKYSQIRCLLQTFSCSLCLSFHFLYIVFYRGEVFHFHEVQLINFFFMNCDFGISKQSLPHSTHLDFSHVAFQEF